MKTFIVTEKSTGKVAYRYREEAPVEWNEWPFSTHDHTEEAVEAGPAQPPISHVMTKLAYLRRFTQEERIAIRAAASQSAVLDDYLKLLDLADEVNTADPDTITAVWMLEGAGLIATGRAEEILNG